MANLSFQDIGITHLYGAVPKNVIKNREFTNHFPSDVVNTIVDKTGIEQRRFVKDGQTASDLCFVAAENLFKESRIDKTEIDILLFISQTPDFRMPATSVTLQHRLGLSKNTAAFDINLGCSAFVYGLSIAYAYANMPSIRKVLVLNGETRSKVYNPKDRTTAFLFGDAGIAAIVEKQKDLGESFFSLNSDGSKSDLIKVNAGGYRFPSSENTIKEKVVDEHGNIRTEENGYMNGADVFNFVLKEIPKNIKETLSFAKTDIEDIDFIICHQANKFMNEYLVKKLKLKKHKVPSTIEKFGNTSSVSIPITIVSELKDKLKGKSTLLLSGFGVGMSWATSIIPTRDIKLSEIIEVD
jgi:3-oxoacyl-[acyl-carrier-protein] synthase-3